MTPLNAVPSAETRLRILFIKFGGMGDTLFASPLVRQVRAAFPQARLEYAVAHAFAGAVDANPHVDEVIHFDEGVFARRDVLAWLGLARQLRRRCYDLAFVLDKHWSFSSLAWLAGIPRRVGFARDRSCSWFLTDAVPYGALRHETDFYLDLLETISPEAVDRADARMEMRTPPIDLTQRFPQVPNDYVICVNSGAANPFERSGLRRLPRNFFVGLIEQLTHKTAVVLLGGKEDRAYLDALGLPDLPDRLYDLAGRTTLAEAVALMSSARKVYTTECGALHLAATTDVPLCIFFGPTHPERRVPLRPPVEAIWADEGIYTPDYDIRGVRPRQMPYQKLSLASLSHPYRIRDGRALSSS